MAIKNTRCHKTRCNRYALGNMAVYCIHACMAFTVCIRFPPEMCKTEVATVVHVAFTCIKAFFFPDNTVWVITDSATAVCLLRPGLRKKPFPCARLQLHYVCFKTRHQEQLVHQLLGQNTSEPLSKSSKKDATVHYRFLKTFKKKNLKYFSFGWN